VSGPLKSIGVGGVCCGACSKSDHSILYNGMTVQLLQLTAMLPTGKCHITLSREKSAPLVVQPFVKIL